MDVFGFKWPFENGDNIPHARVLVYVIDCYIEKTPFLARLLDERGGELLFVQWECSPPAKLCELCSECPAEEREKVHKFFRMVNYGVGGDDVCKKELAEFVDLHRSALLERRDIENQLPHIFQRGKLFKEDSFPEKTHSKKKLETDNMNSASTATAASDAIDLTTPPQTTDIMEEYKLLKNRTAYHADCIANFWFNFPNRRPEVVKTMERVVELQKPVYNKLKRLHNSLTKTAEAPTRSAEEEEPADKKAKGEGQESSSKVATESGGGGATNDDPAEAEIEVVSEEIAE